MYELHVARGGGRLWCYYCVCSAVACGVCFCWLLVLLLLWRVVVVVELGGAHSHGNTHMPHSPTDIVQLVAALGSAV